MKELVTHWFEQTPPFQGILACGVRHPDHSSSSKVWGEGYSEMAVENALRCVVDLFQVLQLNRLAPERLRWVYQDALLHCERRPDGTCLGVFTVRNSNTFDQTGVDRFFQEFLALSNTTPL